MSVVIHEPTIDGSTIEAEVTVPRRLRRFFNDEPFRAEYDVDLEGLPPAVATIPVLAHVCPVAWTKGAEVTVPVVDETFLEALREIRGVLQRMYPEFMKGGPITPERVVDVSEERPAEEFDDSAMLFTGGIDSIASYVRNREEDPALICIQGWVIGVDQEERWRGTRRHIEEFSDQHGLDDRYVRSNMLSFLDMPMLQAHYKRFVDGAWYSSVGHGLGLIGLCAPLADRMGFDTIHMAASHTEEFDEPWGSHPDIDNKVRWGHTQGNHDGYELTRQDKVELIADYARETDRTFRIRTCTQSATGDNCNECEKCYRTIAGLVLAGLDPNEFGYEADWHTFDLIRQKFEASEFVIDEHTRFHWEDIQNHVDLDREFPVAGAPEFFRWLAEADVRALAADADSPSHYKMLRAVARNVPYPVYASLYPVYTTVKRRTGAL